ncbi:MAG: hypothetical protein LC790_19710, partial [Actinobacteria bacterium]|nr:hypothetical protein [Actinomycetota bacterium]
MPPKPAQLPTRPEGKINTSDPDSRRMKTRGGFLQGYNAQAVTTEGQIVVAAEVITEGSDFQALERVIDESDQPGTNLDRGATAQITIVD